MTSSQSWAVPTQSGAVWFYLHLDSFLSVMSSTCLHLGLTYCAWFILKHLWFVSQLWISSFFHSSFRWRRREMVEVSGEGQGLWTWLPGFKAWSCTHQLCAFRQVSSPLSVFPHLWNGDDGFVVRNKWDNNITSSAQILDPRCPSNDNKWWKPFIQTPSLCLVLVL